MTKQQKQARTRSSINKNAGSRKNGQQIKQQEVTKTRKNYFGICSCVVVLCVACIFVLPWKKPNLEGDGDSTQQDIGQKGTQPSVAVPARSDASLHNGFGSELHKNFKPNILNRLQIKSTNVAGMMVKVKQLQHSHKDTTVRVYVLENFFSAYECDALSAAHDNHVSQTSRSNPLLCFDSVKTFRQNLKEVGLKIQVSGADFLQGTTCINESLSLLVKKHGMKWSYSTSFYPGESKFSLILQERIKQATGLMPENGGKFQITSYPQNVDDGSKMTGDVDADISVQNVPSKTKSVLPAIEKRKCGVPYQ